MDSRGPPKFPTDPTFPLQVVTQGQMDEKDALTSCQARMEILDTTWQMVAAIYLIVH